MSIAEATNADFVRINVLNNVMMFTDQGIIEGEVNKIAEFNKSLNKDIEIFADVFVKHAVPPEGSKIENHTEELINRAGADGVIVTGDGTGHEINIDDLKKVRDIVPSGKLAIGSGVNETNIDKYEDIADILIIGTSFKLDNNVENPVDFVVATSLVIGIVVWLEVPVLASKVTSLKLKVPSAACNGVLLRKIDFKLEIIDSFDISFDLKISSWDTL